MENTLESITTDALETKCLNCGGAGGETERGRWYPCADCGGGGYVPTALGRKILSLVRHNFRLMHDEIANR